MKPIPLFQVDAFTNKVFGGNPAAICILDEWLAAGTMQLIAAENNLAETAFIIKEECRYLIRWFTPSIEVDLCGHATLAAAHVLFQYFNQPSNTINFYSERSGSLSVSKSKDLLTLNFPADSLKKVDTPQSLTKAFGREPLECYRGKTDYMLVYQMQEEIENLKPDLNLVATTKERGVIVTAKGNEVDFVSRFFAPQSGIDEDPVTGSAHTTLTPFWSKKLNKNRLTAMQLSKRQGYLECELKGERILISGKAISYLKGEVYI